MSLYGSLVTCRLNSNVPNSIIRESTGSIGVKHARYAIQSLGLDAKKEDVRVASSNDKINYDTFLALAGSKLVQRDKALRAFELFDKDSKGVICFEDLQRVAQELGESITEEELLEMLDDADKSGQGFLSQDDFLNVAKRLNLKP